MGTALFANDIEEHLVPKDTPTAGDDLPAVGDGATGPVDGPGGTDDTTVTTETGLGFDAVRPLQPVWNTDDTEPPLSVTRKGRGQMSWVMGETGNDGLVGTKSEGGYVPSGHRCPGLFHPP